MAIAAQQRGEARWLTAADGDLREIALFGRVAVGRGRDVVVLVEARADALQGDGSPGPQVGVAQAGTVELDEGARDLIKDGLSQRGGLLVTPHRLIGQDILARGAEGFGRERTSVVALVGAGGGTRRRSRPHDDLFALRVPASDLDLFYLGRRRHPQPQMPQRHAEFLVGSAFAAVGLAKVDLIARREYLEPALARNRAQELPVGLAVLRKILIHNVRRLGPRGQSVLA